MGIKTNQILRNHQLNLDNVVVSPSNCVGVAALRNLDLSTCVRLGVQVPGVHKLISLKLSPPEMSQQAFKYIRLKGQLKVACFWQGLRAKFRLLFWMV